MSRIGKQPVRLPQGVEVQAEGNRVRVKGPKGELQKAIDDRLEVRVEDGVVTVLPRNGDRRTRAQHGLARTLIHNMVVGVSRGYQITLDIVGVGYRATQQGRGIQLSLGYSHPIRIEPIEGIELEVEVDTRARMNRIHVRGIDKQKVGQVAANLRALRPPEPYKGKGIRYLGEQIRRKMGKAGKAGA